MSPVDFTCKINILSMAHAFSVTSWLRTPARNEAVGGAKRSKHLFGLAVDCVLDDPSKAKNLVKSAGEMGLVAIEEGDHVHIQSP